MSYPIVREVVLPDPKKKSGLAGLFRAARRERADFPQIPAGHVAVLGLAEGYKLYSGSFDPEDDLLQRARTLSVVNVREEEFEVSLDFPGQTGADQFHAKFYFTCKVRKPERVVESFSGDIARIIRRHIVQDDKIRQYAAECRSSDINLLRAQSAARVRALSHLVEMSAEGMEIAVGAVEISTPAELREFDVKLREEERRQEIRKIRSRFERDEALEKDQFIFGEPEAMARKMALLGSEMESIDFRQVIDIQYNLAKETRESEFARDQLRVQFAQALVERGFFDRTADALALVEQLGDAGPRIPTQAKRVLSKREGSQGEVDPGDQANSEVSSDESVEGDLDVSDDEYLADGREDES